MMLLIAWNEPLYPAGIIDRYEITLFSDLTLTVNTSNLSAKASFQYNVNYSISITPFNSFGQGETTTVFVIVRGTDYIIYSKHYILYLYSSYTTIKFYVKSNFFK